MTTSSELAHLAHALKAPRIRRVAGPLAERARAEGWDYQRYLAAVLEEEVLARESSGGQLRVKAARLPAVKTLDDFDFSFQRSVRKQLIVHLAQLDFLLDIGNHRNQNLLNAPYSGTRSSPTSHRSVSGS